MPVLAALLVAVPPGPNSFPPRLVSYLRAHYGEDPETEFTVAWADLDGDGAREAIVYIEGAGWCGSGGCQLLVLTPRTGKYRQVAATSITRPPVRLLPTRHKGWRDIGVFVSGGGILPGYTAALRFDGRRYSSNPSVPPAARLRRQAGTVLIGSDAKGQTLPH